MFNFVGRVRRLRFFMPKYQALKMALNESRQSSFETRIWGSPHPIVLRGGTSDIPCFEKVFMDQEYLSPFDIEPKVIVDAGANIGMSTVYFANRYPNSRIIAIEPEADNIRMLQRNCGFFPNVTIIQGALWSSSGEVSLTNHGNEPWTFAVTEGPAPGPIGTVRAYSMLDILKIANADRVDLLKLDIEGAEKELFSGNSDPWLDRVSVLAIELHDRYKPGCARAFYSKLIGRDFHQEVRGENIFIQLRGHAEAA